MTRVFVKGETEVDGITIDWVDTETEKRIGEFIPFNDYLYIKLKDFEHNKDLIAQHWKKKLIKITKQDGKDENDEDAEFAKLVLRNNKHKYYLRSWLDDENIKHYEGDLNTTKRYTIDNFDDLQFNIQDSPYLFYDLETVDIGIQEWDEYGKIVPNGPILSFAGTDYKGRTFFFINEDYKDPQCEIKLLNEVRDLFKKYSITSGWFSDGFDDPYLAKRCEFHNIPDVTKLVNKIDYLDSYKKYHIEESLKSYKLDSVGEHELGEKKEDIEIGGGRLIKTYLTDKEKLKKYNIQDTNILYQLNKKLKFMELHLMTASLANCRVELTKYNIGSNDYFVLIKAKKAGLIAPSNPTQDEKQARIKWGSIGGGYTRGIPGFYKNVATFDFSSLYPSLECTYNISPEKFVANVTTRDEAKYLEKMHQDIKVFNTKEEMIEYQLKNNYIITPSDLTYAAKKGREYYHPYRFYKGDKIGLLPSIMVELLDERVAVKKRMKSMDKQSDQYHRAYTRQLALKYMLNSNYGLNALPAYRFFRWDVADSITTSGRVNTKRIRKFAFRNGFKPIYSDTDSIGIMAIREDCVSFEEFDKMLVEFIDKEMETTNNNVYKREDKYGVHNHRLILEYEKLFKTLLYKKKKRYVGIISNPKGDDYIDITGLESVKMNVLAAKLQMELMKDVIHERFNVDEWKIKMNDLYDKCYGGEMDVEDLCQSMKFTARAADMKAPRAHTLLAERMIASGKNIAVGDKIKYVVESIKPRQYAVSPEEFLVNKKYPPEYYWEIFVKPLVSLLGVVKPDMVFNIIQIPSIQKIEMKLAKETDDDKKMKLMTRVRKHKEKWLDNEIDENEQHDHLF